MQELKIKKNSKNQVKGLLQDHQVINKLIIQVDRYNFKVIEKKWQSYWEKNKSFKTNLDLDKKKILLLRNVSIPIWKNSYGSCKKLYNWRRFSEI